MKTKKMRRKSNNSHESSSNVKSNEKTNKKAWMERGKNNEINETERRTRK